MFPLSFKDVVVAFKITWMRWQPKLPAHGIWLWKICSPYLPRTPDDGDISGLRWRGCHNSAASFYSCTAGFPQVFRRPWESIFKLPCSPRSEAALFITSLTAPSSRCSTLTCTRVIYLLCWSRNRNIKYSRFIKRWFAYPNYCDPM